MFFVRSILGLGVVFALLPVAPEDRDKIEDVSPIEAISAAANTMRDVSGFCGRNPQTCETGSRAAVALGYKAKYGAQQLLEKVNDKEAESTATLKTKPAVVLAENEITNEKQAPPKTIAASTNLTPMPTPRVRPEI
ncbi:MAG: DUF5330 domain-containing protein [Hyphomicrobiales bacterium]